MKKNIKSVAIPISKIIKKMAVFSANSASPAGVYQPKEPKEMQKFKRNK